MAYSFTLQDVEDEIVKRLGESTAQTILDEDNEDRIVPMFWTSVTDIIIAGEYKDEDIAGLIKISEQTITTEKVDLSDIDDLLRYHDIYSEPGNAAHLNKIILEKDISFIKQILQGDPRNDSEVYVYKIGNVLKFFKDNGSDDVNTKNVNIIYVKSPDPEELASTGNNMLSTYSLGFIYKAIDLTVKKIKQERQ